MSFTGLPFFAILIGTVLMYFIVPSRFRWIVLLLFSIVFYVLSAGWQPLLVVVITAAASWYIALKMGEMDQKQKRRPYHIFIVILLLSLLIITKLVRFTGVLADWIIVPLGISYYTFSLISYETDIYYNKAKPEKSFPKLLLLTLFFPKIIQGPISRFHELGKDLFEGHTYDWNRMCFGLQRMLFGYFKKLVIAERAGMMTSKVFNDFSSYSGGGSILLIASVIGAFRLYCDFSGYMDIVVGFCEILGIRLEENFNHPFFSKTVSEFWRRWHITLGAWFKDYVYMPLSVDPCLIRESGKIRKKYGKKAAKNFLQCVPLAVVWILTGLWHGTGIDYLAWGIYWGTLIILSNLLAPFFRSVKTKLHISDQSRFWHLFQMLRTFCIFTVGLLISIYAGIANIPLCFKQFFLYPRVHSLTDGTLFYYGLGQVDMEIFVICAVALLMIEAAEERGASIRQTVGRWHPVLRWTIYAAAIVFVVLFGIFGPGFSISGFAYAYF